MATKAKAKPAPKLKEQLPPPGKFKARTAGYEFTIKDNGYTMVHRLRPMTDSGLMMWQRDMGAVEGLSGELAAQATIEVWTQAWLRMVDSVDGYEGIEDGASLKPELAGLIPFFHINQVITQVLEDVGVIAGDAQKNS